MHPLELYRWAVQDPETHAEVLRRMHEHADPPRPASILREDFAGTSADSVAWLALERPAAPRHAIAIDLHAPTLAWAYQRACRLLGPRAARFRALQLDALQAAPPRVPHADIIAALNFSALYLHTPAALSAYLRAARASLAQHAILALNLFGGPASIRPGIQRNRVTPAPRLPAEKPIPPFDYLWEIRAWDPARQVADCRIHFDIPAHITPTTTLPPHSPRQRPTPPSEALADHPIPPHHRRLTDAFRYDFRIWSPRELLDACLDAGFSNAEFWRHTYHPDRGPDALFLGPTDPTAVRDLDSWTAYIVART